MAPTFLESCFFAHSQDLMEDPVVASDGHSYERESIERWFEQKYSSPVTNAWLASTQLIPNHALRDAIQELKLRPYASQLSAFRCPIGLLPMVDPVIALDGYTYDRRNIKDKKWLGIFTKKSKSPITKIRLNAATMLPNHTLKQAIAELETRAQNPELDIPVAEEVFPTSSNQDTTRSIRSVSAPIVQISSDPPNIYCALRKIPVLWSPNIHDAMPADVTIDPNALVVGIPLLDTQPFASFIEIDGDALGLLVDKVYLPVECHDIKYLERVDPIEDNSKIKVLQPIALTLWPTVCPVDLLTWLEEGEIVDTEAIVFDSYDRTFYRCERTKCWLYVDTDNASIC